MCIVGFLEGTGHYHIRRDLAMLIKIGQGPLNFFNSLCSLERREYSTIVADILHNALHHYLPQSGTLLSLHPGTPTNNILEVISQRSEVRGDVCLP